MDLEDIMMANRVKQILENKIRQEGGCSDCNGTCGNGVLVGDGVMVGGKRKRKPSAFNKRVAAYMKKTGVSLPVAARRMAGSKTAKKKRPAKRRKVRGGVEIDDEMKQLEKQIKVLKMQEKLSELADDEESKWTKKAYCSADRLKRLTNPKDIKAFYQKCEKKRKPTLYDYEKAEKLSRMKNYLISDKIDNKSLEDFLTETLKKKR